MKFVKVTLSIHERLTALKSSIEWLALTYIPCYDHDTKKWTIERFPFSERLACFHAETATAIVGYRYRLFRN